MSLSLLTLFLMMLVTLIVITGQYRQSARVQARVDRVGDPPHKITDIAVKTVLTGRATSDFDIAPHSLFADLYGWSWRGRVVSVDVLNAANSETTDSHIAMKFQPVDPSANLYLDTTPGEFSGCVLTFVAGTATKGVSVRILEYRPPATSGANATILFANSSPDDPAHVIDWSTIGANAIFVVNGRPFSGYGAGYGPNNLGDPNEGYNLSQVVTYPSVTGGTPISLPAALLPNYRAAAAFDPATTAFDIGRFNEDYDALDYQNMFLAYVPADAQRADEIVPSFWRPELINYWRNFEEVADDPATRPWYQTTNYARRNAFYRMISLRPLPTDHPEFTGSNPDFAMPDLTQPLPLLTSSNDINGNGVPDASPNLPYDAVSPPGTWPPMPGTTVTNAVNDVNGNGIIDQWDVDNDNDGLTDSIWVDIGLPVQRMEDGKLYKPLVAYLIRDLDGLSNVNAHMHNVYALAQRNALTDLDGGGAGPLPGGSVTRSKGRGYGPAELGLSYAYDDVFTGSNRKLLDDAAANPQLLSVLVNRNSIMSGDQRAGRPNVNDLGSRLTQLYVPNGFAYGASTAYGSPPDVWGAQGIALDYTGQPWNNRVQKSTSQLAPYAGGQNEAVDEPYEVDLYHAASATADTTLGVSTPDTPYSLAELERILRWNDADASFLPSRLATAGRNAFDSLQARRMVTTHSSHIPFSPTSVPSERRASADTRNWWLYDLYKEQLIKYADFAALNGNTYNRANPEPLHLEWIDVQVKRMMPWEAWHGMKFDLNRAWQNGADDDGDGTVDEPAEAFLGLPNPQKERAFASLGTLPPELAGYAGLFDHLGLEDDVRSANFPNASIVDPRFARQVYARHLYCLAMMLADYDPNGMSGGFNPMDAFENGPTAVPQARELFSRRMAQWAINVVDARDPDAICSPFEYDVNPHNGWQVDIDGQPLSVESGERRIVWGMETPDLLITETVAFHNRRVKDTNREEGGNPDYRRQGGTSDMQPGDDDLDQHRIPQGSLFVELYASGNRRTNDPAYPEELYDGAGRLDLGRIAPGNSPVWRLAVSVPHHQIATEKPADRLTAANREVTNFDVTAGSSPETVNLDLVNYSSGGSLGTAANVPLERFVWLGPATPPANRHDVFYARNVTAGTQQPSGQRLSTAVLEPGRYAVVGPRARTVIGVGDDGNPDTPLDASPHEVRLAGGVQGYDFNGTERPLSANYGTKIRQGLSIIAGAEPPTAWNYDPANGIGMNISEPLPVDAANYYREPTNAVGSETIDPEFDGYYDATDPDAGDTVPDRPFDEYMGPLSADPDFVKTRTHARLRRSIFLQRLADPTLAYDPLTNPYLTFDWQDVDLTVFNGDDRRPDSWPQATIGEQWDPSDDEPMNGGTYDGNALDIRFMSRERGERDRADDDAANNYAPSGSPDTRLWRYQSHDPDPTNEHPTAPASLKWRYNLAHTLGYLNVTMGMDHNSNLAGYTDPGDGTVYKMDYLGAPNSPFPWRTHFDAPFASPLEIMNVPQTSQSAFGLNWTVDQSTITAPAPADPYGRLGAPATARQDYAGLFKQLPNFFHSDAPRRPSGASVRSPQFYRLFDYVETPSPYTGSRYWIDDRNGSGTWAAPGTLSLGRSALSRFRDPGRINLNTMPKDVWNAFGYSHEYRVPGGNPSTDLIDADRFEAFRRGYPSTQETWRYPTRIARPFREAGKADLAPELPLSPGYAPDRLRQEGIQATLLRSYSAAVEEPLFGSDRDTSPASSTVRNPYFRFESLSRLPNLTSTQSNVYAVWVTVGYFEATKTRPTVANYHGQPLPDGVYLGQEIGADTGRNRRHRAFYVIDRSIPAAFEPGNDHNVEKTILLRRYLD
jgi:hypothetical protein